MHKDLEHLKQDTFRYWFADGLSDIVIGSLFLIVGGITLLQGLLEPGSAFYGFFGVLVFVVVMIGTPLSRRLIRTLKEHLTYPRTGYIAYKAPTSQQRFISTALAILIAVIVLLLVIVSSQVPTTWLPLILGLILAGLLFIIGYRNAVLRYQLMAAGAAATGLFISTLSEPEWLSTGIMLSATGLMLLFSGLITLVRYLRNTQPDREAADGS